MAEEAVVSEMAGGVTGRDRDLWLLDIDEERSGWAAEVSRVD